MSFQLTIFATGIVCDLCNQDPGRDDRNMNQWNGFIDLDVNKKICWACQEHHYKLKNHTEHTGLYSEYPFPLSQYFINRFVNSKTNVVI